MRREKPILMSGPMVRATNEGRKTQTRRLSGLDEINENPGNWELSVCTSADPRDELLTAATFYPKDKVPSLSGDAYCRRVICPYPLGIHVWIKETHAWHSDYNNLKAAQVFNAMGGDVRGCTSYLADDRGDAWAGKARPSIFMPRWASRITLEITEVRVQRLQEISEEDAKAEGVEEISRREVESVSPYLRYAPQWKGYLNHARAYRDSAKDSYASLWDSINGADSWAANPFVWAITFQRVPQTEGETV